MTIKNLIEVYCRKQGITQTELSQKLGYANRSSISKVISSEDGMNMKLSTLVRWLEELDCQIVIECFDNEEEYILDGEDEEVE